MTLLTGGEVVAKYLIREKVPYVAGIPGHGNLGLVDAFKENSNELEVIQVRHEQSACFLADGYYRVTGRPLAVFTSIGPGATNTVTGLATAYVDSTAMIVFDGETHSYMYGVGVLQEIERQHWADFHSIVRPVVKRTWRVGRVDQLPRVLQRAFALALTGRPGPVQISLPMDVQAEATDVEIPEPAKRRPIGRVAGDLEQVSKATDLIAMAQRPVILAGGGVITADASQELVDLAEFIGAPIITTMMGKGAIPEDHPLCALCAGAKGTTVGNKIAREADVLIAVGCRFEDQTTSSYKPGVTFNIPPTKLIHIDIDPYEIGKNYPVEVGIVGDAKAVLQSLIEVIRKKIEKRKYKDSPYFMEFQKAKEEWQKRIESIAKSDQIPMTTSRFLAELRKALRPDAIVTASAGHSQGQLLQEFPVYYPRTHISSGGFSTMGFAIPAGIGAKLAKTDKEVVTLDGDGSFMITQSELATAVQYDVPIVSCVLNNYGWLSIRDLQMDVYGKERKYVTEFIRKKTGKLYNVDFVKLGQAYGCYTERVDKPEDVQEAIKRAFKSGQPSLLEIPTAYEHPTSEGLSAGWWDVPIPRYLKRS